MCSGVHAPFQVPPLRKSSPEALALPSLDEIELEEGLSKETERALHCLDEDIDLEMLRVEQQRLNRAVQLQRNISETREYTRQLHALQRHKDYVSHELLNPSNTALRWAVLQRENADVDERIALLVQSQRPQTPPPIVTPITEPRKWCSLLIPQTPLWGF
jgi:hypothetical protein